jgi:hypothetical protein
MTLRARLVLLVAATLAPMALCAVVAAWQLMVQERSVVEGNVVGRARSAMSAVDAHLRGTVLALQTLAASKNLESGDLAAYHAEAQRVLKGEPAWVNISLMAPSQQVLSNAVYAFGKPEPRPPSNDSLELTAKGTKVGFSNVRAGNVVRNPTVRVNVPVQFRGEPGYILIAPLNIKKITDVLQAQRLPETWTIVLVDRDSTVIAAFPPVATGAAAPEDLRKSIEPSPEGWTRGADAGTHIAHVTSDLSGWVLAISVPPAYVEAGARRSLAILLVGVLLALAVGIGLAWLTANRTS